MNTQKQIPIIQMEAAAFQQNETPALVLFSVRREVIESGNIASVLERLHILTDSPRNVSLYKEAMVLSAEGYDDDPRELWEVKEVKDFFKQLVAEWPHWFWFLARNAGMVAMFLNLLCETQTTRTPMGSYTQYIKSREAPITMSSLYERGSQLFKEYGVSDDEYMRSARSAVFEITRTIGQ